MQDVELRASDGERLAARLFEPPASPATQRWPRVPLYWIGHSVGAQILGLVPNRERVTAMLSVAAGSGYWKLNGFFRPRVGATLWPQITQWLAATPRSISTAR